jgi:peroxiredoxin Q/BCP
MAAKKRSGKKAPASKASKARSKKASTRAGSSKKVSKKASKKKKKASKKTSPVAAAAPVAKKTRAAKKKSVGKKRAGKKSPAPAPERIPAPPESEPGEGSEDGDDDDGDDGEEETVDDDEPDEGEPYDLAPSFDLPDQHGQSVSSADLAGNPYVLYFYPKDDTPGCTTEACGFRDALSEFEAAGVTVLGVSPDSPASHKKFADKFGLTFQLLSDPDKQLAKAYGIWVLKKNYGREFMGIERSTFLVGADGRIKQTWRRVRVNGHVAAVQEAAASL